MMKEKAPVNGKFTGAFYILTESLNYLYGSLSNCKALYYEFQAPI